MFGGDKPQNQSENVGRAVRNPQQHTDTASCPHNLLAGDSDVHIFRARQTRLGRFGRRKVDTEPGHRAEEDSKHSSALCGYRVERKPSSSWQLEESALNTIKVKTSSDPVTRLSRKKKKQLWKGAERAQAAPYKAPKMSQSQPGRDAAVSTFVRAPKRESSLQTVASASSRGKQPGIAQMPSGKVASPPLGSRSPKSSVMRSSGPLAPRLAHQAPKSRSSMTSAAPVDAFGGDVASGGTHGLGFKLEDPAFTAPLHIKKRSLTAPASSSPKSPSSPPPALNSQRKATASSPTVMPFPEFCIPELSDAAVCIATMASNAVLT